MVDFSAKGLASIDAISKRAIEQPRSAINTREIERGETINDFASETLVLLCGRPPEEISRPFDQTFTTL